MVTNRESNTADDYTVATAALDRLQISEQTARSSDDAEVECKPDLSSEPIILCDAFYGFPTQKRPRNERVRAVSRQLMNFIQWRSEAPENTCCTNSNVHVLGGKNDVEAVKTRVDELGIQVDVAPAGQICFQPDVGIHQFLNDQTQSKEEIVYLSPDANYSLPATSRPPRIVIVGMLIDRRITEDRSRRRAEDSLNIRAAKLPLDELRVKELSSEEPLNVDTVMELMQRWWWNCEKVEKRLKQLKDNHKVVDTDSENYAHLYKKCFVEAAAFAMKTQRDRHPNRTVHKTD